MCIFHCFLCPNINRCYVNIKFLCVNQVLDRSFIVNLNRVKFLCANSHTFTTLGSTLTSKKYRGTSHQHMEVGIERRQFKRAAVEWLERGKSKGHAKEFGVGRKRRKWGCERRFDRDAGGVGWGGVGLGDKEAGIVWGERRWDERREERIKP